MIIVLSRQIFEKYSYIKFNENRSTGSLFVSRWRTDGKYENGKWKSRTNRELEEMRKGENIVKWIKGQRISWLGHLERMEEDRMPKKIFNQELEGKRRRGRPRTRWKEEVEKIFKCWEWEDGESWWQIGKNGRTLFDRPKLTVDCSANGIKRRTDGWRDMTKLIVAFRNFANAPKSGFFLPLPKCCTFAKVPSAFTSQMSALIFK